MSYDEMAMAKELFSDTHETDARVKYGNATGDATEKDGKWTVPVAIDNADDTETATYVCDAYIAKGTRVKLVCDPTGRYIVCAWGDAIDKAVSEEAAARETADNKLQGQIDNIDVGVTSATASTGINIAGTDAGNGGYKGAITVTNTGVTALNASSGIFANGGTVDGNGYRRGDVAIALDNHASSSNTYGVGTSDLYGHLKISSDLTKTSDDTALSVTGGYNLNGHIDNVDGRVIDIESQVNGWNQAGVTADNALEKANEAYELAKSATKIEGDSPIIVSSGDGTSIVSLDASKAAGTVPEITNENTAVGVGSWFLSFDGGLPIPRITTDSHGLVTNISTFVYRLPSYPYAGASSGIVSPDFIDAVSWIDPCRFGAATIALTNKTTNSLGTSYTDLIGASSRLTSEMNPSSRGGNSSDYGSLACYTNSNSYAGVFINSHYENYELFAVVSGSVYAKNMSNNDLLYVQLIGTPNSSTWESLVEHVSPAVNGVATVAIPPIFFNPSRTCSFRLQVKSTSGNGEIQSGDDEPAGAFITLQAWAYRQNSITNT